MHDYRFITDYVTNLGFRLYCLGGNCPIQLEAQHPKGIYLYARSRHDTFSLELYQAFQKPGDYLPDKDKLIQSVDYILPDYMDDAGWISAEEFTQLVLYHLQDWKDELED